MNTVNTPGGGGGAAGAAAAAQHASIPDFMAQMMAAPQQRQRGEREVATALGAQEPAGAAAPAAAPAAAGEAASDSAGGSAD